MKFTGLTHNLGQLYGSYRDFQSNCWVNLRILGQPCEFYLAAGADAADADAKARKLLGWPKRYKLAHALMWEYSYERLKLAQLLGQLGVFLT